MYDVQGSKLLLRLNTCTVPSMIRLENNLGVIHLCLHAQAASAPSWVLSHDANLQSTCEYHTASIEVVRHKSLLHSNLYMWVACGQCNLDAAHTCLFVGCTVYVHVCLMNTPTLEYRFIPYTYVYAVQTLYTLLEDTNLMGGGGVETAQVPSLMLITTCDIYI